MSNFRLFNIDICINHSNTACKYSIYLINPERFSLFFPACYNFLTFSRRIQVDGICEIKRVNKIQIHQVEHIFIVIQELSCWFLTKKFNKFSSLEDK